MVWVVNYSIPRMKSVHYRTLPKTRSKIKHFTTFLCTQIFANKIRGSITRKVFYLPETLMNNNSKHFCKCRKGNQEYIKGVRCSDKIYTKTERLLGDE